MPGNSVSSPMAPRLLADQVDAVIGVDTHTDTHSACLVNQIGAPLAEITVTAGAAGYAALVTWAREQQLAAGLGPRLVWAVEGSRSNGETALEAARPTRLARRPGGKSDPKDALHAARTALATSIIYQPRADGPREALRTLLIVRASAVTARTDAINQVSTARSVCTSAV